MTAEKPFDCIAYKRAVQAKHAEQNRGLAPPEKTRRRAEWLKKSGNPAARLWRDMLKKQKTAAKH